jgi:hypothetical protein
MIGGGIIDTFGGDSKEFILPGGKVISKFFKE